MSSPAEKGNALEAAVAAIETHILNTSPGLREKPFLIESKKIITTAGVRHEIDIFVTIDIGDGYKSIFIFECKNWEEAVGKNELIVFSEKVSVTQAQKGFFVAKSFTKDAQCQAATDPRVELLTALEHDANTAPLPFGFHTLIVTPVNSGAVFRERGVSHRNQTIVDLATAKVTLRGEPIDLRNFLSKWAEVACSEHSRSFRSERLPEGTYERETVETREYAPGELLLNQRDIECVEHSIKYNATVVRPPVMSYYEVETRGRVASLGPIQNPFGIMSMKLIWR